MERKRLRLEFKAGEPDGTFRAVFAEFDKTDNDGDVTLKGAFPIGAKLPFAQVGHNWDVPTIGNGVIAADETKVWLDGQLNLKMAAGREHYESMKFDVERGVNAQQFSYAYDVVKGHSARPDEIKRYGPATKRILEQLVPHEVSPVMLGAGTGTGLAFIKRRKAGGLMVQHTHPAAPPANDGSDDGAGVPFPTTSPTYTHTHAGGDVPHAHPDLSLGSSKGRKSAQSFEDLRSQLQDAVDDWDQAQDATEGEDPDAFPDAWIVATFADHVIVDDDDGYVSIPYTLDADGTVVLGEATPVEQTWAPKSLATRASQVTADTRQLAKHARASVAMRAKEGRTLSAANRERISSQIEALKTSIADLEQLLADTAPAPAGKSREDLLVLRSSHAVRLARLAREFAIPLSA